jgi:hypothetical protein
MSYRVQARTHFYRLAAAALAFAACKGAKSMDLTARHGVGSHASEIAAVLRDPKC